MSVNPYLTHHYVLGAFSSKNDVERCMARLGYDEYPPSSISIYTAIQKQIDHAPTKSPESVITGTALGTFLGTAIGTLYGVGLVPGIEPIVRPFIAALIGLSVGAIIGFAIGASIKHSNPEEDEILVSVQVNDREQTNYLKHLLHDLGAKRVIQTNEDRTQAILSTFSENKTPNLKQGTNNETNPRIWN